MRWATKNCHVGGFTLVYVDLLAGSVIELS